MVFGEFSGLGLAQSMDHRQTLSTTNTWIPFKASLERQRQKQYVHMSLVCVYKK